MFIGVWAGWAIVKVFYLDDYPGVGVVAKYVGAPFLLMVIALFTGYFGLAFVIEGFGSVLKAVRKK